jgi:hypothetical protein
MNVDYREFDDRGMKMISTVTNWICPNGHPGGMAHDPCTECNSKLDNSYASISKSKLVRFTRSGYSHLYCPWCKDSGMGWRTDSDGVTRSCCSTPVNDELSCMPDPYRVERMSALMLETILLSIGIE